MSGYNQSWICFLTSHFHVAQKTAVYPLHTSLWPWKLLFSYVIFSSGIEEFFFSSHFRVGLKAVVLSLITFLWPRKCLFFILCFSMGPENAILISQASLWSWRGLFSHYQLPIEPEVWLFLHFTLFSVTNPPLILSRTGLCLLSCPMSFSDSSLHETCLCNPPYFSPEVGGCNFDIHSQVYMVSAQTTTIWTFSYSYHCLLSCIYSSLIAPHW